MRQSGFASLFLVPFLLAAAPPPLEPAGPWGIDYGANRCTLYRLFGSGRKIARLSFEQTAPLRSMSVYIGGSALPHGTSRDNSLNFAPLGGVTLHGGQSVITNKKENAVYFPHLLQRGEFGLISDEAAIALARSLPNVRGVGWWIPGYKPHPLKWDEQDWQRQSQAVIEAEGRAFSERAAKVDSIQVNTIGSKPVTLHTGSLKAPLNALEKCARDSLKDWGVDPLVEDRVAIGPHPASDETQVVRPEDYPKKALDAGMESSLDLWLNIDARGQLSSCRVISTFASPDINDRMCKLIKDRQTFVAAKATDGSSVASFYIQSFRFIIAD